MMALADVTNQLAPGGPLHSAFALALARAEQIDQKAVATLFCYIVGAHFAEDYRYEPRMGEITEQSVRTQAEALLKNTRLFQPETIDVALTYIWRVTKLFVDNYLRSSPTISVTAGNEQTSDGPVPTTSDNQEAPAARVDPSPTTIPG